MKESLFTLKAIPLCAQAPEYLPSLPSSPKALPAGTNAEFLPPLAALHAASLAAEKKRKQVANVFDEATERKRKARRSGGEDLATAASVQNDSINYLVGQKRPKRSLKTQTSISGHFPTKHFHEQSVAVNFQSSRSRTGSLSGIPHDAQDKMLSCSPSAQSDPCTANLRPAVDSRARHLTLSRVSSLQATSTTEERNKEIISRLVMAGMRLYGLQPRKRVGHVRRHSEMSTQVQTNTTDTNLQTSSKDDEYKLVYHQTYKGAVFALRHVISSKPLYLDPTEIQDIVDKLLTIFCGDASVPAFRAGEAG
ncbi:hypothetical protein, variant 2 [Verruconis gallopava]|nr:hypothetical protein, variant 2 [Verruconis gallopava]KIV99100.1 hypothetical protein, variant 2 [Verruconis gallopava]